MMRRIDLLPELYVARKRERRNMSLIIAVGMLVLALLFGWWLLVQMNIRSERERLEAAQEQNRQLQAQIDELERFAVLANEVQVKQGALQTVFQGDVGWPGILTDIAQLVPGQVSLDSINGSVGIAEGAQPAGTETAAIRISQQEPQGRIQFNGTSDTMDGVAQWLTRLASAPEFSAAWLNNATGTEEDGTLVDVIFDSTLELNQAALSERFQGAQP